MGKLGNESLKRLERLGDFISEYSVRNKNDENIPVYSVTNDKGFCTGYFSKDVSSKDRTTYKIVPYGCFAYNPSRINVGSIDWQHCEERVIVSPLYVVFKVSDQIDRRYLLHYLKSDVALTYIKAKSSGSVRDNLKLSVLQEFPINLRSLEEQKKVAGVLDAATVLAAKRRRQLALLDTLTQSRFVEMFGDPNDRRSLFKNRHKIGELCDVTKLAGFEFTKYIKYQKSGDIIMLRGLNCKSGKLVLDDVKYIDRETSYKLPRSRLYAGDILMTYAGTIGDVAMVDEDDKYHLAPNVAKITITDKNKLNPVFLIHLFMYSHDYIMTFASQVAQASINMQKIREFEYEIPCIDKQNEFAEFVSEVDRQKAALRRSLTALTTLKSALMQEYFGN